MFAPGDSREQTRSDILFVLDERRQLGHTSDDWFERYIAMAVSFGATRQQIEEAAGVSGDDVRRIAAQHRLELAS